MVMARYRKKPVVIEAVQFSESMARGDVPLPDGVRMSDRHFGPPPERRLIRHRHYIETLEGKTLVAVGDYVITGVAGEVYPCKPEIFAATHEAVERCDAGATFDAR